MSATARIIEFPTQQRPQPPRRRHNTDTRSREHLTADEIERMLASIRKAGGRVVERDTLVLLIAFRHGLRAGELTRLRWDQVDLKAGLLHVNRMKNGTPSTHPLHGPELRALRAWQREQGEGRPYVFTSLRGGAPIDRRVVHRIFADAGKAAGIPFPCYPHMARHACGFKLANDGQDTRAIQLYLGHKNIQHTVRYTELSPERFKDFWQD
jgi:type 1 fimbriae regulatory protein FimB/type 1 fimbriae regulatory protein FimE